MIGGGGGGGGGGGEGCMGAEGVYSTPAWNKTSGWLQVYTVYYTIGLSTSLARAVLLLTTEVRERR